MVSISLGIGANKNLAQLGIKPGAALHELRISLLQIGFRRLPLLPMLRGASFRKLDHHFGSLFLGLHCGDLGIRSLHQFRASGNHPFFRFPGPVGPILFQIGQTVVTLGLFRLLKLSSLLSKRRLLSPKTLLLLFKGSTLLLGPFVPGFLFLLRGRFRSPVLAVTIAICSLGNIVFRRTTRASVATLGPNEESLGAPSKASSLEAGPCGPLDMETTSLIFSC